MKLDRRLYAFMTLASVGARMQPASVELAGVRERVHLALTGRRGGDFGILIADGRARISGQVPRPATSIVQLKADLMLELLAGQTDFSRAQLTGRIRTEGAPIGSTVLAGLIASFRAQQAAPGRDGAVARALGRWLQRTLPDPTSAPPSGKGTP